MKNLPIRKYMVGFRAMHPRKLTNSSPEKASSWLSWLLRVGFWLLVVVFLCSMAFWWFRHATHRQVERVVEQAKARIRAASAVEGAPGSVAVSQGFPAWKLPFIGRAFSEDEAVRIAFEQEVEEIRKAVSAYVVAYDAAETNPPPNIKELATKLGLKLPGDCTPEEAEKIVAKHFLEQLGPRLEKFREDLRKAPWDYGPPTVQGHFIVGNSVATLARGTSLLLRFHFILGQQDAAMEDLKLQRLAHAETAKTHLGGSMMANHSSYLTNHLLLQTLRQPDGWTDAQLAEMLRREQQRSSSLLDFKMGVENQKAYLDSVLADLPNWLEKEHQHRSPVNYWQGLASDLEYRFLEEQRHQDAIALLKSELDTTMSQISSKGTYVPLPPDTISTADAYHEEAGWLQKWYLKNQQTSFGSQRYLQDMRKMQSSDVMCQVVLQLEQEHRRGGAFPETLPTAVPPDPMSGQPYHYERTATGYRLWSAEKPDYVFEHP